MIIFGFSTKVKELLSGNHICENCGQITWHILYKVTKWFTLFFIPVFPYSSEYFIHCNACGFKNKINANDAKKLVDMVAKKALDGQQVIDATAAFATIDVTESSQKALVNTTDPLATQQAAVDGEGGQTTFTCSACGAEVGTEDNYCMACGEEFEEELVSGERPAKTQVGDSLHNYSGKVGQDNDKLKAWENLK